MKSQILPNEYVMNQDSMLNMAYQHDYVYWCNVICKTYYVVIIKAIHNVKPAMYTLPRVALLSSYKNYHSWTRDICYFRCVKEKVLANQKLMLDKGILQIWRGPSLRECHFTKPPGNFFFCLYSIWKFNASSYFMPFYFQF